jgi:hypothetical protein
MLSRHRFVRFCAGLFVSRLSTSAAPDSSAHSPLRPSLSSAGICDRMNQQLKAGDIEGAIMTFRSAYLPHLQCRII